MKFQLRSKLTILCGAILLASSLIGSAFAQGAEITNITNGVLNHLVVGGGKTIKEISGTQEVSSTINDLNWAFAQINNPERKVVVAPAVKQSAKVLAIKQELLANIASANITLDPAVVALLPAGEFVQEKEVAKISVVAGLARPDVRRLVLVLKREGTTYPYVTDVTLPTSGMKQFEPVEVFADTLLGTGNYTAWIFSLREDRSYIESVRTRLYSGLIEHADDENGMRLSQFTTTFTGVGWYATMKGHDLGLRSLVVITYFGLIVPFRVYPVVSGNGDAEANFELPMSVSQPFSDITLRCDVTIQNLDGFTFESVTRRQFAWLRTRYVPQQ